MPAVSATQSDAQTPVTLYVNGEQWWFSVATVRRVGRDLFVHVALHGPDVCTVTIHLRDGIVLGTTARDILTAACDWLLVRGTATHAFIDLVEQQPRWLASEVA
jgi:hypothetical protein